MRLEKQLDAHLASIRTPIPVNPVPLPARVGVPVMGLGLCHGVYCGVCEGEAVCGVVDTCRRTGVDVGGKGWGSWIGTWGHESEGWVEGVVL